MSEDAPVNTGAVTWPAPFWAARTCPFTGVRP